MKTILLCIITILLSVSCSADEDFEAAEILTDLANAPVTDNNFPANPINPFDMEGKRIYEALEVYYQKNHSPNSVSELADQIRHISNKLDRGEGKSSRLIPFTDEMVQSIMDDPDNSMISIVQNSVLQAYAKTNLINFLQHLIVKRLEEFSITYSYITDYEEEVLADTVFTSEETETILTVASISRYSLYSEEERKDKDWDILVGSKPARPLFGTNEVPIVSIIALLERIL
ncbi:MULTISPECIES: hypothetical protein [Flavobacterium]|uniref:Gliding motility-associated protein GldM N-terminal domain-containing protein n=1 Tax=Flavobacterium ginsenosidimutans TaxID=687844 RepID=A0ABZ2Q3H0_9FLAO|nr:hypothetical protein [Flavobacterium sp. SH_e]MCV2484337.1 hypothetical protein [Flavobacterium sp. SH_e]